MTENDSDRIVELIRAEFKQLGWEEIDIATAEFCLLKLFLITQAVRFPLDDRRFIEVIRQFANMLELRLEVRKKNN